MVIKQKQNYTELVSIIIPSWNGKKYLEKCLLSIFQQTYKQKEVIVVDNGSSDKSLEYIINNYSRVKIIKLSRNYGFSTAVSVGITRSKGKYILILNNDTFLDKRCVEEMVISLKNNKQISAVSPLVLNFYQKNKIDSAGVIMNTLGQAFNRGRGEAINKYLSQEFIFIAPAVASLFRKDAFETIGYFDKSFFAYGEDVDWSLRAQLQGCKIAYTPKAKVYHVHKGTSRRNPEFLEYLQYRNAILLILRNFPSALLLRKYRFILIPLTWINSMLYLLKKGYFNSVLKAHVWIVINFPRIIRDRLCIQKKRVCSIQYLEKQLTKKEIRSSFPPSKWLLH